MRRLAAPLLLAVALVACGGASGPAATPDPIAGQYIGSGGGAALQNVQVLAKRFQQLHTGVDWQLENVGSSAAIKLVKENQVDLGFVSRELTDAEKVGVSRLPIGSVGTAVAVNAANPLTMLTRDQVRDIFSGKITDWKQVGAPAGTIRVFIREPDAATRTGFEEYFFGSAKASYVKTATEVTGLDDTMRSVGSFADSIAMISLDDRSLANTGLHLVGIDGVAATKENLQSATYPVRRPLYIISLADEKKLKPGVRAFLDFVRGAEGQKILSGL